jgi:[ribosomal protein S5]-alanine N-acetyltransferase
MLLEYETQRLRVFELTRDRIKANHSQLLARVIELLSPAVVENLPPSFHDVNTLSAAQLWLDKMLDEGELLALHHYDTNSISGFLFVHVEQSSEAQIGYLLGESYWGQGLATELLSGFIELCIKTQAWSKLIGGVDVSNKASSHLLSKLGFSMQPPSGNPVVFFEYQIPEFRS